MGNLGQRVGFVIQQLDAELIASLPAVAALKLLKLVDTMIQEFTFISLL